MTPLVDGRRLASNGEFPIEEYYLPLNEAEIEKVMKRIKTGITYNPMISTTSISILAEGTIIWYDHHEDGYEADVLDPSSSSTEIWGDGNCDNGHAPDTCADTGKPDEIGAGTVFTLENPVNIISYTRDNNWDGLSPDYLYDSSDRLLASFPVAITRSIRPGAAGSPGGQIAGGTEVLNTDNYGTEFIAPVGVTGTSNSGESFELTEFHVMGSSSGTEIIYTNSSCSDGCNATIERGASFRIENVRVGDYVTSTNNRPVQVHLITGNVGSTYELRWFSMLPTSQWDKTYYTPVGYNDVYAFIYNPNDDSEITVTWVRGGACDDTELDNSRRCTNSFLVGIKSSYRVRLYDTWPAGVMTGYKFYSDNVFFGVIRVDDSVLYDWGHTLIPENQLSSQVLISKLHTAEHLYCDFTPTAAVPHHLCSS